MGKTRFSLFIPLLLVAALIQVIFGNPDLSVFAFPVNAAIVLLLFGGLYVFNREYATNRFLVALASGRTAVSAIVLTGMAGLVMLFFPSLEFQKSWIFDAVLLLLVSNLFLALLRYRGRHRWRFYLNHAGLLILVVGLAFGAADMRVMRAPVKVGKSIDKAYTREGVARPLGYTLTLKHFEIEYYDAARQIPADFRAEVVADGESRTIRVNAPWHKSWKEDIYLAAYDTAAGGGSEYGVLEFVVQPWKNVALAGLLLFVAGSLLMVWGGKKKNLS